MCIYVCNFISQLKSHHMMVVRPTCTLRCVHSLLQLQRSCVTDVSITYLPQRNPTHCTQVHFLAVPHCSSRRRDGNTTTATYRNAAAVDYECTFSGSIFNHYMMCNHVCFKAGYSKEGTSFPLP